MSEVNLLEDLKVPAGFNSFQSTLLQLGLDALVEAVVVDFLVEKTNCLCNLDAGGLGSVDQRIARMRRDDKGSVASGLAGNVSQWETKMTIVASVTS